MAFEDVFTPRQVIPRRQYVSLGIAFFVVAGALWVALTTTEAVSPLILPTPGEVVESARRLFLEQGFVRDIWTSLVRIAVGFVAAALVAVPLGILMGTYQHVRAFFEPLAGFARYMPAAAFVPLVIVWFGIGDTSKIAIIYIGVVFHLLLMVMSAARSVPIEYMEASYTLGADRWDVLRRVVFPASLPGVVTSLRITLGYAWTYIVVAELVAADSGIGAVIMRASRFLRTGDIFVGILTIGILGLLFDFSFNRLSRRLFPYLVEDRA